ncbi:MAG: hypothetical protein IPM51_14485 [Sphingobacteriaceae bacterium]|nr:hypothetical protein [Sphingobacteriaceae bacterium]
MHKLKIFGFILFIGFGFASAQNCKIAYEYSKPEILSKNKVKEVKVYKGLDSAQKLFFHFFLNESGCPYKLLHYDLYSKGVEPVMTEYSSNVQGTIQTFQRGRLMNKALKLYEKTEEVYTESKKIISRKKIESIDFTVVTIQKFDTLDYEKTFSHVLRILPNGGDTLSSILSSFDKVKRIYVYRLKNSMGWIESEKLITYYAKEKMMKQERFKDGILTQTLNESELNEQKVVELNHSKNMENPLPYTNTIKIDTSYSDTEKIALQIKDLKNKKGKFMVIRFAETNDNSKVEHADLILQKNGLIQKSIHNYASESLRFEYILK